MWGLCSCLFAWAMLGQPPSSSSFDVPLSLHPIHPSLGALPCRLEHVPYSPDICSSCFWFFLCPSQIFYIVLLNA